MIETSGVVKALIEGPHSDEWAALGLPSWDQESECWRDHRGRFAASPLRSIPISARPLGVPYYNPEAFRRIRGL